LFGEYAKNSVFKEAWHSQDKLTAANIREFQGKAKAIMTEQLFTARARKLGFDIFDVTGRGASEESTKKGRRSLT
jgi:hypothetical protein